MVFPPFDDFTDVFFNIEYLTASKISFLAGNTDLGKKKPCIKKHWNNCVMSTKDINLFSNHRNLVDL